MCNSLAQAKCNIAKNFLLMSTFENNIASAKIPVFNNSGNAGVVFASGLELKQAALFPPSILFPLETAVNRFRSDAVYFRYSEERKAYMPELYIFDYTDKAYSSEEKNRIHRMMWNGSQVPAYMIVEKTSISIYNARLKPSNDVNLASILAISSDAFSLFPSNELSNGLFWENLSNEERFDFDQSATKSLIVGLKKVYASFQSESRLDKHTALRLLMQCILIKYLEERDDSTSNGYFASHYFRNNFGCEGFCDTIRQGKLLDLLDLLAKDFNGKIFEWSPVSQSESRAAIQKAEVRDLANYLDADSQDDQYVLWRLYSFSYLPVEVISSVYEELLTNSKDIVYTPEMIVSSLVDECMPLENPREGFKMIDVSCGSGIFLVKAYKRVVQWWRYNNWKTTGRLDKPSLSVLQELLLNSIHGVDIEQDAVNLSIFSLALAMLDEVDLTPPTWEELKFPDMSKNLSCQDFFRFISCNPTLCFDLVIGNPPFNLKGEDGKEPKRKMFFEEVRHKYGYVSDIAIPDENPALHFLYRSMGLLKDKGLLCMIQPSGPLLYQDEPSFKCALFGRYNLLQIIDFTNLDDKLWGKKRVATAAVFIENTAPTQEKVLHLIANRSFSNTHKLFLEFDHYDFYWIDKQQAICDPYVWKANLLGGSRVSLLLKRFLTLRSLRTFLEEKKQQGWTYGEGFMEANSQPSLKQADYITGKPYLDVNDFIGEKEDNIIKECLVEFFHRPRAKELYEAPHLLFRKVVPFILCFYDEYVTFCDGIFAIHAPSDKKDELLDIKRHFEANRDLLQFLLLSMSSRVGILKATSIYLDDLLKLPYPEKEDAIILNEADKIVVSDALRYYGTLRANGVHKALYQEKALNDELLAFAEVFCKGINSILSPDKKHFSLQDVLISDSYSGLVFTLQENNSNRKVSVVNMGNLDGYLESFSSQKQDSIFESKRIRRILRICSPDSIILIKPAKRRYWLKTIALRDSDELFAERFMSLRYA